MRFRVDWKFIATILLLFMITAGVLVMVFNMMAVEQSTTDKQLSATYEAIDQALDECYAQEGSYTPSLEYLEKYHGLKLNHTLFDFHYDNHGVANFLPEYNVIVKEGVQP